MNIVFIETFKEDLLSNFGNVDLFFNLTSSRKARFLLMFRFLNFCFSRRKNIIYKGLYFIFNIYYSSLQRSYNSEVPARTNIGGGVNLPHLNGIVINPETVIGKWCTILHQVTIGNNLSKGINNLAVISDGVHIGAGAKIIGPCKIGKHSIIGANAVVVKDVGSKEIVAGVPAQKIGNNIC